MAVVESVEPLEPMITSYSRPRPSRKASRRSVFDTMIASSLKTGMTTVNGVALLDDVGVAIGHVPVVDVVQDGHVLGTAARAEVPRAKLHEARHAAEAAGTQMAVVARRQERRQERGAALGHVPLGEAEDLARDLGVDQRAGEQVDDGAERQVEEGQHPQ